MHIIIIITVVIFQIFVFAINLIKLNVFKHIFPDTDSRFKVWSGLVNTSEYDSTWLQKLIELTNNYSPHFIRYIEYTNPLETIIESINGYLRNNKGAVSDFHLIKDIVDRNCDAKEEEIHTLTPIPLYLGLVGTMAGILIGIGKLISSGSLSALLGTGTGTGAAGVEALLGGIAIAMISSIVGILLTTISSYITKDYKAIYERNKNTFLSWIQANLLPKLSNSTAQTLETMSQNLTAFNKTFSTNTSELGKALSQVNESYRLQMQLFEIVKQIADKDVSTQNLRLYEALKNSGEEIGTLAKYLNNTNQYLDNVKALNEKLDANDQRTKAIEEMARFFKTEISQIEQRKGYIAEAVGKVDDKLQQALEGLRENAERRMNDFNVAAGKQQTVLQEKLEETSKLYEELRNLTEIKNSIANFARAMKEQNTKIDKLVTAILDLAGAKSSNGVNPAFVLPKWVKIAGIVVGSSVTLAALGVIVFFVLIMVGMLH